MAGIQTSPKINLQIRNQNAIERRKHGSPNFKDILRQRCKERMQNRRSTLINRMRALSTEEDKRLMLSNILETDLKQLNPVIQGGQRCSEPLDSVPMDISDSKVYNELSQEEQWILEEYDKLLDSSEALQEILEQVVCPFCEKGCLDDCEPGIIRCKTCDTVLKHTGLALKQLEQCLNESINIHEDICLEKPYFSVIPDNFCNIFLICSTCNFFFSVV